MRSIDLPRQPAGLRRPARAGRRAIPVAALVAACLPVPASAQEAAGAAPGPAGPPAPTRIVLFIADGTGISHWSAALFDDPDSPLLRFPVGGFMDTRNVEDRIPDSAASATALATGVLTRNRYLGVDADGTPRVTILERAAERGLATGLVATSTITHATPAAFAVHMTDRNAHAEIAARMAGAPIGVLLGGGLRWFDPAFRTDGTDPLGALREGRRWVAGADELAAAAAAAAAAGEGLVGLFAADSMRHAAWRRPTLAGMTDAALRVLDADPDGFVLVVEASQVDWRSHDNEGWDSVIAEMRDAAEALAVLLAYLDRNPETLLVVTADHETGGAAVVDGPRGDWDLDWAGHDHTADLVPLFAAGRNAGRFGGVHRIDEVGRLLASSLLPSAAAAN